jgi:hypothetical protein
MKKGLLEKQILEILEECEQARNDDMVLATTLWIKFYEDSFAVIDDIYYVKLRDMRKKLPREDHISRIRRKIQNDRKLFLPTSEEVRRLRRISEDDWYAWSIIN